MLPPGCRECSRTPTVHLEFDHRGTNCARAGRAMLSGMLERLTCADFLCHLNEPFTVEVDGTTAMCMELVDATESDLNPGVEASRRPFSLVFAGPGTTVLPQRIYRMKHPEMGELDLFIVPIGRDSHGVRYEAIFT